MKNCKHLVPQNRRIALYEPGNESLVHATFATLEDAQRAYNIPDDTEIEQGLGQLYIAVPYLARKLS